MDAGSVREPISGSELVVVSVLAQVGSAGHNENGLGARQSRDNRSHPCVRDYQVGFVEPPVELRRFDERLPLEVLRAKSLGARIGDLADDMSAWVRGAPIVDRASEPVERQLSSDGQEDQTTAPS
jgi:hypothetical protein